MEDKISELIERLKEKTLKKKANWQTTSSGNQLSLMFVNGRVTTDLWREENGDDYVDFTLYNKDGDEIYSVAYSERLNPSSYQKLAEFYNIARSNYYRFEETIDSIFREIEGDSVIGQESTLEDPF